MGEILKELTTSRLVQAIKGNLFEYYRFLGSSPKAEFREDENFTWLLTEVRHPFLNAVMRTNLNDESVDEQVEEVLDHYRLRGLKQLSWWNERGNQPQDLAEHLLAHGLVYTEGGAGMAIDLRELSMAVKKPEELSVERVTSPGGLEQWVEAFIRGFELAGNEAATFDLYASLGFEMPLRSYVGILNNQPVATAQLFLGASVAGIYCVATVEQARKTGIASNIVLAALEEARNFGYHAAILHSTAMGYNVYQRLGFRELCRMSHFNWSEAR